MAATAPQARPAIALAKSPGPVAHRMIDAGTQRVAPRRPREPLTA
ncbi:hypothetical protein ACQPZA_07535 [Pseudonocardia xinjiangensis]